LATRTRLSDRLRPGVSHARNPNNKGKLVVDLIGDPAGPPKIPGNEPACSWGPPNSGITFRVSPPDFDISKAKATTIDMPLHGFKGAARTKNRNTIASNNDK
jgi:hypothetical protein